MKNPFLSVLLGIAVILQVSGCSTKIDTAAPYKNLTFVYGLLDASDTAHYVRIQKGFLSQDLNAYDMAKIPDSSFYLNLDVTVKEINPITNVVHNTFTLTKVNMNDEGYPKDSGVFFTNPSYAYKFKQTLSPSYKYRLIIYNPQTGETDSAQTLILSEDPLASNGFRIPYFDIANYSIGVGGLSINPQNQYTLPGSAPDSSLIVETHLRFKWVDRNMSTGQETDQYYDWLFGNTTFGAPASNSSSGFVAKTTIENLVTTLRNALGTAPANTQRFLDSSDIYIYAGTAALYNYQVATQQAGLGITGSSIQPVFSNISGKNVYGIFSARAKRFKLNIPFEGPTFTYIVSNSILSGTGIQPTVADH